jgi:diguanylate cyclase (GGDEF)-like protein/PAS domain S-box-containing protein
VLESTSEAFLSIDRAGVITAWSRQAEELFGWTADEVLGRKLTDTVIPAAEREELKAEYARYRAGSDSTVVRTRVEATGLHRDGHEIPIEVSSWPHQDDDGLSVFAHDITERVTVQAERNELQATLRRLAEHDPLTGLWNRRRFDEELHREAVRCKRYGEQSAVLMIDLDEFKNVNDTYGHQAGDELLELVARRVRAALRESDSIARIGGDEFAALLPNTTPPATEEVAEKLRQVILGSRITVDGIAICVGASIGSQALDENAPDQRVVMAKADAAMYLVKAAARR